MTMRIIKTLICAAMIISAGTISGCGWFERESAPNDLLDLVTQSNYESISYYAEAKMSYLYKDEAQNESITLKEWVDAKKGRQLWELLADGKINYNYQMEDQLLTFTEGEKVAYKYTIIPENSELGTRERFMSQMETMRKDHHIQQLEDEKLLGRPVQRLHAVPKEKTTFSSETELWIDKETWMVLKSVTTSEESTFILEYTRFETKSSFDDEIFVPKLPKNVKIEDVESAANPTKITFEQAAKILKGQFLYYPEDKMGIKLSTIEKQVYPLNDKDDWIDIAFHYETKDGVPLFKISTSITTADQTSDVSEMKQENKDKDTSEEKETEDPFAEFTVQVRNNEGMYWDELQSLTWEENGQQYDLMSKHPDLKKEELIEWANKLQPYPNKQKQKKKEK